MFKRWRILAATAGATLFPFAMSHAAPRDDAMHCTRSIELSHQRELRFDWQTIEHENWLSEHLRKLSDERSQDERPGCLDPQFDPHFDGVNEFNRDSDVRGGNDDFHVSLGFEQSDDDVRVLPSAACADPACPSNQSTQAGVEISLEFIDDRSPVQDDECFDDAFCPCFDAIILHPPQAIDDDADDATVILPPIPANDDVPTIGRPEPFAFDDSECDTDARTGGGEIVLETIDEIIDSILELLAPAASAELTGTIEFFDEADETSAVEHGVDPQAECDGQTTSGPQTRFHMFYPGVDWSRYLSAGFADESD